MKTASTPGLSALQAWTAQRQGPLRSGWGLGWPAGLSQSLASLPRLLVNRVDLVSNGGLHAVRSTGSPCWCPGAVPRPGHSLLMGRHIHSR